MHQRFLVALLTLLAIAPLSIARAALTATVPDRTPGAAVVTNTGAATYEIPLSLPAGTRGLTPRLGLLYRQDGGRSVLGLGWQITGLSEIKRCRYTRAQDGVTGAVTVAASDRLCLDGQRLRLTSPGAYGASGSTYQTEIDSYARITANGTAGNGAAWFKVESPDGLIYEYGNTSDSRVLYTGTTSARVWALNQIRDRSGNYISFKYINDTANGSYRPEEIRYAGNLQTGTAPAYAVKFSYEASADQVDAWASGSYIRELYKIGSISIEYQGSVLRRYELNYESASSPERHNLLKSVQECTTTTNCRQPTTIEWLPLQNGWNTPESGPIASASPASVTPLDMNGDGYDDLAFVDPATGTWRVTWGAKAGFGQTVSTGAAVVAGAVALTTDLDSNGKVDLLVASGNTWWWLRHQADGTFAYTNTGTPATGAVSYNGAPAVAMADIDGDGYQDLVFASGVGIGPVSIRFHNRDGSPGFESTSTVGYSPGTNVFARALQSFNVRTPLKTIDVNGDGRQDLLLTTMPFCLGCTPLASTLVLVSTGTAFEVGPTVGFNAEVVLPADMNGDGCTDFVVGAEDNASTWKLRISKCHSTQLNAPIKTTTTATGAKDAQISDWNGDGLLDLVYPWKGKWRVMAYDGSKFAAPMDIDTPLTSGLEESRVADVNGDGLLDLVHSVNSGIRARLHAGPPGELVKAITDGFGITARFTYAPMSDPSVYTRSPSTVLPLVDLPGSRSLVKTLTSTDGSGTGSLYSMDFSYGGAARDLLGRGSLGFSTRTITDQRAGEVRRFEEVYLQAFPYTGRLARITQKQASGARVREQTNTWTAIARGTGDASRHFPYVSTAAQRNFELGGASDGLLVTTKTTVVSAIDSQSGLVTDATVTTVEGSTGLNPGSTRTERVQQLALLNDATNWCQGRPQSTLMTSSHSLLGGAALSRRFAQVWDSVKCRPARQQLEPGNAQWEITADLGYDTFGNLASQTVTGIGMAPRTTTTGWDATGRFPESSTNALGEVVRRTFNAAQGLQASETDANGLITTWQYDAFGEPILETRADGTQTARTVAAYVCTSNCDTRARQLVTTTLRDAAGVVQRTSTQVLDQFGQSVESRTLLPGGGLSLTREERDASGRVIRRYVPYWSGSPGNGHWQYTYDLLDRVTSARLLTSAGALSREIRQAYGGLTSITTDGRGNPTTRVRSAWGDLLSVVDAAGGTTRYQSDANGALLRVTDAYGNQVSTIAYGATGHKVSQTDMDLGSVIFARNALGELTSQTNAKGQMTSFTYDRLGRPVSRTEPEGTSTWVWGKPADNTPTAKYVGRLRSISGPGYAEAMSYDALGRPGTRTITSDTTYQYDYTYNALGTLDTLTYPASAAGVRLKVKYAYSGGRVSAIRDYTGNVPGTTYWQRNEVDQRGNVIDATLGNGLRVVTGFDPLTGQIDYRLSGTAGSASNVQNLSYQWDANDNLRQRQDLRQSRAETFEYDALDRLDRSLLNGSVNLDVNYDLIGNVTQRNDVGPATWTYHATRRHAVTNAGGNTYVYDANGNATSRNGAALTWYSYDLPAVITSGTLTSQFAYAPDRSRWRQVASYVNGTETTVYVGGLLEKLTTSVRTHYRHLVAAPDGLVAIVERRSDGTSDTFYVVDDHLGSTDVIVNAAGTVVSRQSFAPFGGRRGSDWSATTPPDLAAVAGSSRRGFTFHEHLDNLGLIHMNGRVYDPVVGRFLSADPFVVSADSGQSLNRYAYVLNNPLSFTDPSGFVPGQDGGPGWGEFPCLECYNVPSTYPHVPLPPHPGPGWHDRPGPNLVAKFDGGALVCYSDNCFVTEDVDSFSARFWRGFNGDSSVILDAEPTLPNTLGRYAGGTLKVALAVAGLAMIAVDVIDTPVSPGPDAGVVGAGLIADTATQGVAARTIISSTRGVIKEIETTADRIFYRVFSESNNRGRWLTSTRPRSSSWAQEALSLPPNNKASFVQEVLVPAGTKLQRSRAAPIPEWARMRGGAEQFKLLDEIPLKSFGPGVPLP